MIRLLLKRTILSPAAPEPEMLEVHYETLDIEHPQLEALLCRGGYGNGGYDRTDLVGTASPIK